MKKIQFYATLGLMFLGAASFAQISGNQAYQNNNNYNAYNRDAAQLYKPVTSIKVSGQDFTVSAKVLINVNPDVLMVTLGLNQEGKTVVACNEEINKRIEGFKQKVKSIGIKEKDIYVDFISQTRIYDYKIDNAAATQFENGFEIKKNIIVRLEGVKGFDSLVTIAAAFGIYDIVQAEYINEDIDAIYAGLFNEALKVVDAKKQKYAKAFNISVDNEYSLVEDTYYSIQPKTQYRQYRAFESSDISGYSNYYIKKEERKNKTFYYQGIDTASFDKVINPHDPQVNLQYVVEMQVVYHIKK